MGFVKTFRPQAQSPFPYLLVNVGSGVSVIKVEGPGTQFQRVSGSTIGGGTLWGLCTLLAECETFDEVRWLGGVLVGTCRWILMGECLPTSSVPCVLHSSPPAHPLFFFLLLACVSPRHVNEAHESLVMHMRA
ncbi:unnamed protein product [Discosporangium mesarthrocarpum]